MKEACILSYPESASSIREASPSRPCDLLNPIGADLVIRDVQSPTQVFIFDISGRVQWRGTVANTH